MQCFRFVSHARRAAFAVGLALAALAAVSGGALARAYPALRMR